MSIINRLLDSWSCNTNLRQSIVQFIVHCQWGAAGKGIDAYGYAGSRGRSVNVEVWVMKGDRVR